jgi:organic hydroperoxide reductase OsmC/OhrA
MQKFPLKYEVKASATSGVSNPWQSSCNTLKPIDIAIPAEFEGPGKAYSPEDLFGLAVLNCMISVYKVLCEKNNITFKKMDGKVTVSMNKSPQNSDLTLNHVDIAINVFNASDNVKAHELLDQAIKHCPVANSIKSGKTCHFKVE